MGAIFETFFTDLYSTVGSGPSNPDVNRGLVQKAIEQYMSEQYESV